MKVATVVKVTALALGAVLIAGSVAWAHAHIAESTPEDGASLEAAPSQVTVRFGEAGLPPQPGQISDGHLEVLDACGAKADKGDSQVNMQDSSITVGSAGATMGRYEIHWFATASDGAEQAGVLDFDVTGGAPCTRATREDAKEDVDFGFDVTKLSSSKTRYGAAIKVSTAAATTCASFKSKTDKLTMSFDTNSDRTPDITGTFACRAGSIVVDIDSSDATLPVAHPSSNVLVVKVAKHALLANLDVSVESVVDDDEKCTDDKVCLEVAPDLGLLSVI